MSERQSGTIIAWDDGRGFGFIRPRAGGRKLFFHVSDARGAGRRPRQSMTVTYQPGTDARGRACATQVRLGGLYLPAGALAYLVAAGYLLGLAVLCLRGLLPAWVPAGYLLASTFTLLLYRSDKARAVQGAWRTPEKWLHACELAGGWPGALVAQWRYRHKNRKLTYQIVFWLLVVANVTAVGWFAVTNAG